MQFILLWRSALAPEIAACSTRTASSKQRTLLRKNSANRGANNFWKRNAKFLPLVSLTSFLTASPVSPATTPPARRRTTLPSSSSTFSRTFRVQREFDHGTPGGAVFDLGFLEFEFSDAALFAPLAKGAGFDSA